MRPDLKAFEGYDRLALPFTDADGHMLGIIPVDDVLDVAEQEATEDIQKILSYFRVKTIKPPLVETFEA